MTCGGRTLLLPASARSKRPADPAASRGTGRLQPPLPEPAERHEDEPLLYAPRGRAPAAAVVGRVGAELPGNRGTPRPVAGDLPANFFDPGSRCVPVLGSGPPAALERLVRKRLRHPGGRSSGAGVCR